MTARLTYGIMQQMSIFEDASLIFSFRKIRSTYTGNCIRVRRSSDDSEQDIGFLSEVLDESELLTFCGAGNGYVTKWYNQSRLGSDAIQSDTTMQAQIVTSGVVETLLSKPTLKFAGAQWYRTLDNIHFENNVEVFSLLKSTTTNRSLFNQTEYTRLYVAHGGSSGLLGIYGNSSVPLEWVNNPSSITNQTILLDCYVNGINYGVNWNDNITTGSYTSFSHGDTHSFKIANRDDVNQPMIGNISEVILFTVKNKQIQRQKIKDNINNFYSIY